MRLTQGSRRSAAWRALDFRHLEHRLGGQPLGQPPQAQRHVLQLRLVGPMLDLASVDQIGGMPKIAYGTPSHSLIPVSVVPDAQDCRNAAKRSLIRPADYRRVRSTCRRFRHSIARSIKQAPSHKKTVAMSSRIVICLAAIIAAAFSVMPASAQFRMDTSAGQAAQAMGMPTIGDLQVGDTGYVASFTPCIERQGLYLPTLATVTEEPLSFAQNLRVEINAEGDIVVELFIGDDVPDQSQGLRQLALTIANASSCAAENYYFPNDYSDLRAIASINGHASLAALIDSLVR